MPHKPTRPPNWLPPLLIAILLLAACRPAASEPTQPPAGATPAALASPSQATQPTTDDRPERLRSLTRDWGTDWTRHTIDYAEILSGGPPRDGIPALDNPQFVSQSAAAGWLGAQEPVVAVDLGGEVRAYPLQILTWHEIVNDSVGGVPIAVTFCPLCNSAIVFDRRLNGQVLEFGTSGLLRNSDLIMYDRTSESLWQQFTGESIVGTLAGEQLTFLPASLISFSDFRAAFPAGQVLSQETGYSRSYGQNPYAGYDNPAGTPFLFDGTLDERLPAMARVVSVRLDDVAIAYPYTLLAGARVINDAPAGHDLAIFYTLGTNSALGATDIASAADVGATGVFDPVLDGQKLTFRWDGQNIVDEQTGSSWNIVGQAIAGPLTGRALTPIVKGDHFWFSWAAFQPDTLIYTSDE